MLDIKPPDLLQQRYPLLKLKNFCRVCWGQPEKFIKQVVPGQLVKRCAVCGRGSSNWRVAGYQKEMNVLEWLHNLWLKCKIHKQRTCGVEGFDTLIVYLFGRPHDDGWQDPYRAGGDHGYEQRQATLEKRS